MSDIEIKNSCIFYYNNPAGYVKENIATVDTIFQSKEFEEWLSEKMIQPIWTDGVFDRLSKGGNINSQNEDIKPLKNVRIWQLKSDSDFDLRFKSYDETIKSFGEPSKENYETVYDGKLDTNNLEAIYKKFNINHPYGFKGHSLSISDVVEFYDKQNSSFHYVDRFGFKEIEFSGQTQEQNMTVSM